MGTIRCVVCPSDDTTSAEPVTNSVDLGIAGASGWREYDRRVASRDSRIKGRFGDRLGGWVLKLTDEPQSTRAWAIGAAGEEKLARELADVDGIQILNDRRVPGTRGNIDHLIVAPAGVFVVDAKNYRGMIRIRNRGSIFRSDPGLFVGRRDCSKLAEGFGWQIAAVTNAIQATGIDPLPRVTPVLCFIDGEWPLIGPPHEYADVRLEGTRSLKKLLASEVVLSADDISMWARSFASAFPPK